MHGVQLTGHGGPEKLAWNEEIPVPVLSIGEVLVRVLAAGLAGIGVNRWEKRAQF